MEQTGLRQRTSNKIKKLVQILKESNDPQECCAICKDDEKLLKPFNKIALACHDTHQFHRSCLKEWREASESNACVLCKKEIKEKELDTLEKCTAALGNSIVFDKYAVPGTLLVAAAGGVYIGTKYLDGSIQFAQSHPGSQMPTSIELENKESACMMVASFTMAMNATILFLGHCYDIARDCNEILYHPDDIE